LIYETHSYPLLAHAKGLLVDGTFTPTSQAKGLSIAPHFNNASTPVIARFSVGGGIPHIPDANDTATPKGIAIRFLVDKATHSDLISHSFDGFATRTGEGFLAFLKVFRAVKIAEFKLKEAQENGCDTTKEQENLDKAQAAFGAFLASNPSAMKFVTTPKPNPHTYGTLVYYEPNTHVLTNKDGKITNVRYRLHPADGVHLYTPEELSKLAPNYLEDDLKKRFPAKPIVFTIQAHIADPTDVLDDATIPYKSIRFINVGQIKINKVTSDNAAQQKQIAFSPSPEKGGIKGMTSSKDPLIQIRKEVYYISADERRREEQEE
jgi:catalase